MRKIIVATAILASLASSALAGRFGPLTEPLTQNISAPPAAVSGWDGFYLGGLASFDNGDARATLNNQRAADRAVIAFLLNSAFTPSSAYGGFVGFNRQINTAVVGLEAAYTTGDVFTVNPTTSFFGDRFDMKARLGFSLGSALVYGVAGYSFADFTDAGTVFSSSGMNYGVGVDIKIGERMFVGAEYLMRDMTGTSPLSRFTITSNLDSAAIRIGMEF